MEKEILIHPDRYVALPLPDGPLTVPVISLPASAFADLRMWGQLGDFKPVDLLDSRLS
jgi:hypothetical protein